MQEVEVREKKLRLETSASSADLQTVQSHIVVNFHPMPNEVSDLYEEIGMEYELRILDPAVEETVKAVTAQYTAEQLITKRTEVRDKMESTLSDRVESNHIRVTKFNIVNFEFSASFNEAIEAKQTAEQEALRAENELKRVEVEAGMVRSERGVPGRAGTWTIPTIVFVAVVKGFGIRPRGLASGPPGSEPFEGERKPGTGENGAAG